MNASKKFTCSTRPCHRCCCYCAFFIVFRCVLCLCFGTKYCFISQKETNASHWTHVLTRHLDHRPHTYFLTRTTNTQKSPKNINKNCQNKWKKRTRLHSQRKTISVSFVGAKMYSKEECVTDEDNDAQTPNRKAEKDKSFWIFFRVATV